MYRNRNLPILIISTGLILFLAAFLVQLAVGGSSTDDEIPAWGATFPPELIATNEAETAADETADAARMARAEQTALAANATKPPYETPYIPSTPTYNPSREAYDPSYEGVVSAGYQPGGGDYGYLWQNSWTSKLEDGSPIEAVAGAIVGSQADRANKVPPIGLLRVITTDHPELSGEYRMPEGNGTLRILAAKRNCLGLVVVETKRSLQFDVSTRLWSCGSAK